MAENEKYILNGWTGAQVILALQKALAGGIPDGSITSVKLDDGCVTLTKLGNDLVVKKQSINLLNPDELHCNLDEPYGNFTVNELTSNSRYSVKINPDYISDVAYYDSVNEESVNIEYTATNNGITFILPEGTSEFYILFYSSMDTSELMVVEGSTIPDTYIPYGEEIVINEALIKHYFDVFYDDITEKTVNLFNPNDVVLPSNDNDVESYIVISGLIPGDSYSFNFEPTKVTDGTNEGVLEYSETSEGTYTINNSSTTLKFYFDRKTDCSCFMVVNGVDVPKLFVPYGEHIHIPDELLVPVVAEIQNIKPKKLDIEASRMIKIHLIKNCVYTLATVTQSVYFILPDTAENGDQILIQANVQRDDAIVDWGTTYYFNNAVPDIDVGKYNFIFEYDDGAWYAGAIPKGQVAE